MAKTLAGTSSAAWLLLAVAAACTHAPTPTGTTTSSTPVVGVPPPSAEPHTASASTTTSATTSANAATSSEQAGTVTGDLPGIEHWIMSRLRAPGRPLVALDEPALDELLGGPTGQTGPQAFARVRVERPALWLLVMRFADYDRAEAARSAVLARLTARGRAPYSANASVTGAYLLVAGFPSDKPVSPEMHAVQNDYLSALAGEE